nr:MAG: DNA pilot protein [Microvirus sp.]
MSGKAAAVIQTIMPAITTAMSGIFAGRQNKLQRQHEANMYQQAQKDNLANWQMQNEYNSPAQMMARLKAAGMNPNLAYGEFSAGRAEQPNYTPQQVSDQSQNLSRAMDFSQMGNVMSNIYDLRIKKGQADLLEAQANTQSTVQLLNTIGAELKRLEQQKLQISNKYDQDTLDKRIQMLSAQYDSILAGINEAKSRTRLNNQSTATSQAQQQNLIDTNIREWRKFPMTMNQLIASYNETIERTNNIKANTGLTKMQTLSEEQKFALITIEKEMAKEGLSKDDSGLDRLIKSVLNNMDIFSQTWKPDTQIGRIALAVIKAMGKKKK